MRLNRLAVTPLAVLTAAALAACGGSSADPSPTGGAPTSTSTSAPLPGDPLQVVAAFYPLAYAAQSVLGSAAEITLLTPPGAEPHDVELTAQQVALLTSADLVLYIPGFQPAVDEAVAGLATAVDAAQGISVLQGGEHSHGEDEHAESAHAEDAHAEDTHAEDTHGHEEETAGFDPHLWLNPLNMIIIGQTIVDRAGATAEQQQALESFTTAMEALNDDWTAGTAECANRDLVVSHEAFAYLAAQYDFVQVGISGLSPEAEPSPARLAEIADFVRANSVTTIYYETLVDPKVAQTLATETGVQTAVLDPLEGLSEGASGDYDSIMRENLAAVRSGQGCT